MGCVFVYNTIKKGGKREKRAGRRQATGVISPKGDPDFRDERTWRNP